MKILTETGRLAALAFPWGAILAFGLSGCGQPQSADSSPNLPPSPGKIESRSLPQRTPLADGAPLFELLGAERTGIDHQLRWVNPEKHLKEYLFLNPIGGICTGDYDGDGRPDIYVTNPGGGNRLYRNLGDFKFEDATVAAGVDDNDFWGSGACFVDIDNDGDLDLYACGYRHPNKLYINEGTGKFVDRAGEFGLDFNGGSMMMSFADIDNDGDLDGYLATTAVAPPPGTKFQVKFVPRESDGVEVPVVLPELREYWELIYLPNDRVNRVEAGQFDRLFRNDGGKFTDVSEEAGIDGPYFTLSATWFDYDADGDADLYVSNDFSGPDMLYRNRGDGTFENVIRDAVPHTPWFSMGSDVGDLNNDGLLDLLASDMSASSHYRDKIMMGNMEDSAWLLDWAEPRQYMRNALYLNAGTGRFREAAFLSGVSSSDWTWSPRIEDFDQDGRADLFVTNGVMRDNMNSDLAAYSDKRFKPGSPEYAKFWLEQPMRKEHNFVFRNQGDLRFDSVGAEWGLDRLGVSFGCATADFDGDGDPDLVVSNADRPVSVYRNNGSAARRIAVELVGTASNRQGLGAIVTVTTSAGTQTRTITSSRGWLSSSEAVAMFGLGDAERVERLDILWPGGTRQRFEDLAADQHYTITEPVGQEQPEVAPPPTPMFERSEALAAAQHEEVAFDDFALQPLLPNKLSQLGPGTAWGDVDGDGDDDFFLAGAGGHAGQIFVNAGGAKFSPSPSGALAADAAGEDLGALFFDSDGDNDLDLYVARGSNEQSAGHGSYRDGLYLNDGSGKFSAAAGGVLPDIRISTGVVVAADVDRDGDSDLFVGGRQVPGQYPLAPSSHLLINSGGKFAATELPELGMVTGAIFSDADNDGWLDLLVTTEWGAVRFLKNESGTLVDRTAEAKLDERLGWWNGIAGGDIDADGDIDYLVSNFGLNTKYSASPKKPEIIFYGDLDGSGKRHIVEAKLAKDKKVLLPRRGFSCSKAAMPVLEKQVGSFHNFASAALTDLYTETRLGNSLRLDANTLECGLLINGGDAGFDWRPLPRIAQIAPSFGVVLEDIDADGDLDAVLAQNSFSPQRETGRMAGGLGQVLLNDGRGSFAPLPPVESGVEIAGDAQSLTVADVDADGRPDLVFGLNGSASAACLNRSVEKPLVVSLAGKQPPIGARVEIAGMVRECYAGGGYLSQSGAAMYFPTSSEARTARVRWPDGSTSEHDIASGATKVTLEQP